MLKQSIDKYVSTKRAMGFKFRIQNTLLQSFAAFTEARGENHVRCQSLLQWAGLTPSSAQKRNRLLTVRRFAIAMKDENNQYEIPSIEAFGRHAGQRRIPHIFTHEELQLLFNAALQFAPR